jgi:hypothetical protein
MRLTQPPGGHPPIPGLRPSGGKFGCAKDGYAVDAGPDKMVDSHMRSWDAQRVLEDAHADGSRSRDAGPLETFRHTRAQI